jgi:hypothetical protein
MVLLAWFPQAGIWVQPTGHLTSCLPVFPLQVSAPGLLIRYQRPVLS